MIFHILNGDALLEYFPPNLEGDIIICRECLIDGPVKASTNIEFYDQRAEYLSQTCNRSKEFYFNNSVSEFEKLDNIPTGAEVHLWFEDDLFCQVNLWYVAHLLSNLEQSYSTYLIRPKSHHTNGFGGLDANELEALFYEKIKIEDLTKFADLWHVYQNEDLSSLLQMATSLQDQFPFVLPAVDAHLARIPSPTSPGRPIESLMQIIQELKTDDFEIVFREFCKRESIYGYGDIQVQRMLDSIDTKMLLKKS